QGAARLVARRHAPDPVPACSPRRHATRRRRGADRHIHRLRGGYARWLMNERQIREQQIRARRLARERERRARARRARLIAVGALVVVIVAAGAIAYAATGGGGSSHSTPPKVASSSSSRGLTRKVVVRRAALTREGVPRSTVHGVATGKAGTAT